MSFIFYYLTEDSNNLKERNEVNYLRSIGRVVIVTRGDSSFFKYDNGVKSLNLLGQSAFVVRAYSLWTKVCYLLSCPSNSSTDRGFPSRNVYTGNGAIRWLINKLWPYKYTASINSLLPTYEDLYFAPFKLVRLFFRDKRRASMRFQRVVVHDSLILRLTRFTPFILTARRNDWRTIANVKSWDNPFYSQFVSGASGYLTWSLSMWRDVQRFHKIKATANHSWGPRPFFNFANAVHLSNHRPNVVSGTIVIGYAAAFCDTMMAAHEVKVVAGIAKNLQLMGVNAKILLRPYPIIPISTYEPLLRLQNVELVDIQGPSSDRYGDGREIIRFGSDEERIQYLSCCHCFLSIATSFTFEAAIFGLPVLQYYVPKGQRNAEHESVFFERLDISDHIQNYFLAYLPIANDPAELASLMKALETRADLRLRVVNMMTAVGFPADSALWNEKNARFLTEMKLT